MSGVKIDDAKKQGPMLAKPASHPQKKRPQCQEHVIVKL